MMRGKFSVKFGGYFSSIPNCIVELAKILLPLATVNLNVGVIPAQIVFANAYRKSLFFITINFPILVVFCQRTATKILNSIIQGIAVFVIHALRPFAGVEKPNYSGINVHFASDINLLALIPDIGIADWFETEKATVLYDEMIGNIRTFFFGDRSRTHTERMMVQSCTVNY